MKKLNKTRNSITHRFCIHGFKGYITVDLHDDDSVGEIFIRMAKMGSTVGGLMDAFATSISIALAHGVPLSDLCDKFKGHRFEPFGNTDNSQIPMASSLVDYIFRWLELKFFKKSIDK